MVLLLMSREKLYSVQDINPCKYVSVKLETGVDTQWASLSIVSGQAVTLMLGVGQSRGTDMMAKFDRTEIEEIKVGSQIILLEEYISYQKSILYT